MASPAPTAEATRVTIPEMPSIGAVDLGACPYKPGRCKCGEVCWICGFRKHMAIHGPATVDEPVGGKPWGHEFSPKSAGPQQP